MEPSDALQKRDVAQLYTRVAPTYGRVGPDIFGYFGRRLVARTGVAAAARVLDVGTGSGQVLFAALEAVGPEGHATGVDLAEGMVAATASEIASRGVTNAGVLRMDAEHLNFDDAAFDAVLCGFAIFWLPHLTEALAGLHRVLRPGGRIGISLSAGGDERWRWYNELLV